MSEGPAAKKVKSEHFPPTVAAPEILTTFFVRGVSLRHRGDVVNGFLCQWREQLGISDWYEATTAEGAEESAFHLLLGCPLEMVHVEASRRPYFLLEFRYPNEEELTRQERNREAGEHKEGEEKVEEKPSGKMCATVSADALRDIASRLLHLANTEADALTYKEKPVSVSVAVGGVTVAAERHKLELRDAEKKKARLHQQQKEAQAANATPQPSAPATTTSFVPRAVRRRT